MTTQLHLLLHSRIERGFSNAGQPVMHSVSGTTPSRESIFAIHRDFIFFENEVAVNCKNTCQITIQKCILAARRGEQQSFKA
jgi:hypothetical protein